MKVLEDIFRTPVRMRAGVKSIEAEDEIPYLPGEFTPGKAGADYAGMKQPVKQFTVESSTGEPPTELGEVWLKMAWGYTVMGSPDHALGIGNDNVNPRELFGSCFWVLDDDFLMVVPGECRWIDEEAIGLDTGGSLDTFTCHSLDSIAVNSIYNLHDSESSFHCPQY